MDTFDIAPSGENRKTMSSLEIAELTGKEHKNVMRDIRLMLNGLNSEPVDFAGSYLDKKGEARECFNLPRRECLILVSGYDVALRARIIDRWEELERERLAAPALDLDNPATLKLLLLSNLEKVEALQGQLAESAETVTAFNRIADADGSTCITDAAKTLQMRPKDLFFYLREHGWIYRRAGSSTDLGYQSKVNAGLVEHKVKVVTKADGSEKETVQVRITAKGLTILAKLIQPIATAA